MKNLGLLVTLLTIILLLVGCTTSSGPMIRQSPNLLGGMSGYYNPPVSEQTYVTTQVVNTVATFNGQPVLSNSASQPQNFNEAMRLSREQQYWQREAMQQQAQNHREAMERARLQQQELRNNVNMTRQVVRDLGYIFGKKRSGFFN